MSMKTYNIFLTLLGVFFLGCAKDPKEMPSVTTPVIEYTKLDENTFVFKNATPTGGYITKWDFAGLSSSTQYMDTIFFGVKGKYLIKLTSNSRGGISTSEKEVEVASTSEYGATPKITKINDYTYIVEDITKESSSTNWNFYNGLKSTKKIDTAYFPFQGSYKISLTSTSPKGTSTAYVEPVIVTTKDDASNPLCSDEVITYLTGGCGAVNGKTWVIDPRGKKTNVGAADNLSSSYYDFPDGLGGATWTEGALNNEYTFNLRNFQYIPKNTNVTASALYANKYFGKNQALYADIQLQDPKHKAANWILNKDATNLGTGYGFTITDGSYIGYFEDRYKYYIVRINADTMYLAHRYNDDPKIDPATDANARYFTFIAKK